MKKVLIVLFACISLTGFAQSDEEVERQTQQNYIQFLKEEGFMPSVDDDGDVMFKKEGSSYYMCPTDDNRYFKVCKWLTNEDKVQNLEIHQAMINTMRRYKAVKIYATSDYSGIWVEVSCFLAEEDDFKFIFYRALDVVSAAKDSFLEEYNGE